MRFIFCLGLYNESIFQIDRMLKSIYNQMIDPEDEICIILFNDNPDKEELHDYVNTTVLETSPVKVYYIRSDTNVKHSA